MRISKANHLKRLLQTQDVLLSTLCYVSAVDGLCLIGRLAPHAVSAHLQLTPFVVLVSVIGFVTRVPRLHGQSLVAHLLFAARYGLIVLTRHAGHGLLWPPRVHRPDHDSSVVTAGDRGIARQPSLSALVVF